MTGSGFHPSSLRLIDVKNVQSGVTVKELRKLPKSDKFLDFEYLLHFYKTVFLFKSQFINFCNSFVPYFEYFHHLIHLNDNSGTSTMFEIFNTKET